MENLNRVRQILKDYTAEMMAEMIGIMQSRSYRNLPTEVKQDFIEDAKFMESQIKMPSYAYYASEGRAAGGFPPLVRIEEWCDDKGIDISAAFPIARKIASMGTKDSASKFLDEFKITDKFEQQILKAFTEDVRDAIIKAASRHSDVEAQ